MGPDFREDLKDQVTVTLLIAIVDDMRTELAGVNLALKMMTVIIVDLKSRVVKLEEAQ